MSAIFDKYPEQPISADKTADIPVASSVFTKRELKVLKALAKQLKKINKSQKQAKMRQADGKDRNENQGSILNERESSTKNSQSEEKAGNKPGKTFLQRLVDVFFKVLPGILCTAAQFLFTTIAGRKLKRKGSTA